MKNRPTEQFYKYVTCQICGMTDQRVDAIRSGWLVSPRKANPLVTVVRCPWDISEWALRESEIGRVVHWVAYMKRMKAIPRPAIPPYLSPHPIKDE